MIENMISLSHCQWEYSDWVKLKFGKYTYMAVAWPHVEENCFGSKYEGCVLSKQNKQMSIIHFVGKQVYQENKEQKQNHFEEQRFSNKTDANDF